MRWNNVSTHSFPLWRRMLKEGDVVEDGSWSTLSIAAVVNRLPPPHHWWTDHMWTVFISVKTTTWYSQQPYHPVAQDWLPTDARVSRDGRPSEKARLLLEEVFVRPARGTHPVVCVGPNTPVKWWGHYTVVMRRLTEALTLCGH